MVFSREEVNRTPCSGASEISLFLFLSVTPAGKKGEKNRGTPRDTCLLSAIAPSRSRAIEKILSYLRNDDDFSRRVHDRLVSRKKYRGAEISREIFFNATSPTIGNDK